MLSALTGSDWCLVAVISIAATIAAILARDIIFREPNYEWPDSPTTWDKTARGYTQRHRSN